ncbi:hypothetical protein AB0C65_35670 [Nocardia sp. NPDC048505]|uniref:hypothetical protein n=1 Tax=Nocardia sp. NPDC048505 TaxID=3155756 RepID=UPI0033F1F898
MSDLVDWVLRGYVWVMKYVLQLFMSTSVDSSSSMASVQQLTDITGGLQVVAAGIGLLVALLQILANRLFLVGDNAAPQAFAGFLLWSAAAVTAAPVLLGLSEASEALATWIFQAGAGPEGVAVVDKLGAALSGRDARLKTEDVIALVLGLLGLLAYIELAIQLFLQKAWLIYATATLPIAGAASMTTSGKTVFQSLVRLACIVLLFKPIAAGFFAIAFMQIRGLDSGADVVTAVLMLAAPAFLMPQVMNLLGSSAVSYSGTPILRGTQRATRAGMGFVRNRGASIRDGFRQAQASADRRDEARSAMRATAPAPTGTASTAVISRGGARGAQTAAAPPGSARTGAVMANRSGGAAGTGPGRNSSRQGASNNGTAPAGGTRTHNRSGAEPAAPPQTRSAGASTVSSSSPSSGTSRSTRRTAGEASTADSASNSRATRGTASTANPESTNRNRAARRSSAPRDTGFNRIT